MKHQHPSTLREDLENIVDLLREHVEEQTVTIVFTAVIVKGTTEHVIRYCRECRPVVARETVDQEAAADTLDR